MKIILNKKLLLVTVVLTTLIVAATLVLLSLNVKKPTVTSTNPQDGANNVSISPQIDINFDSNISSLAKSKVSVKIDPQTGFDSTWVSNTYKIIPKTVLVGGSTYKINVFFNSENIYTFSFNTTEITQTDIQKYGADQTQNDFVFGQATKDFVQKYPWYTKLPIKSKDYIVDYDFNNQKFVITFLTQPPTGDQLNQLTNVLTKQIKDIGYKGDPSFYLVFSQTTTP